MDCSARRRRRKIIIKTTSFIPPSVIKLHLLFAHACANNKCNLITLGGVNEVVLIVLTSVTDQK
jgi:hypothetical protein